MLPQGIIMASNIFARLETLKKWQQEQQERLLRQQSQQTDFISSEKGRLKEALDLEIINTPLSSHRSLENHPNESPPSKTDARNLDEQVIATPDRDFNQILDEKLKIFEPEQMNKPDKGSKPKKPFLRKGTGLARYRLSENIKPLQRSTPKMKKKRISWANVFENSPEFNVSDDQSVGQLLFERELEKQLAIKKERLRKSIEEHSQERKQKETKARKEERTRNDPEQKVYEQQLEKLLSVTKLDSNMERIYEEELEKEMAQKYDQESRQCLSDYKKGTRQQELDIFKAQNHELETQNHELETIFKPNKKPPPWSQKVSRNEPQLETFDAQNQLEKELAIIQETNALKTNVEQRITEKQLEKDLVTSRDELKIFEFLEQKALSSSFCSTSSVIMKLINPATPQKETSSVNSSPIRNIESVPENNYKDSEVWTSADEESGSESSTVSESENSEASSVTPMFRNVGTNTEKFVEPTVNVNLLRHRLEELEKEIETFREENAKVQKMKNQVERERSKKEKELEEQRKQLEDDRKKIIKDKQMLHDKYVREVYFVNFELLEWKFRARLRII